MKKLLFVLSILITSNLFAQVNTGNKVYTKVGGGGTTDTSHLSDRINSKQDIIPNLGDTSKYLKNTDTTKISIYNLGGGVPTLRGDSTHLYSANISGAGTVTVSKGSDSGIVITGAGGSGGNADSLGSHPASYYLQKGDSTIANRVTVNTTNIGTNATNIAGKVNKSDSGVVYVTPNQSALKVNISDSLIKYITPTQIKVKYDSTQFIIATTAVDSLQTSAAGFSNFNGGVGTYDATNKRLNVTNGDVAGKGVFFGPALIQGHRYAVHVNISVAGGSLSSDFGTGRVILTNMVAGDNFITFVAPAPGSYGNKILFLTNGSYSINSAIIQEVPLNFTYATKGDIVPQLNNYTPIINNTNALKYVNVTSTNIALAQGASAVGSNSIAAGNNASVAAGETGGIAIGPSANVNSGSSGGGGEVAVGTNTIASGWRSLTVGGYGEALAVSSSNFGYGGYVNQVHGQNYGRGGMNTLGGVLFYEDAGAGTPNTWWFGAQDAAHTNPAMPGGETTDFSAGLNSGAIYSILRGYGGIDTKPIPTLTNVRGGAMRIAGGASTGTAAGGDVELAVTPATGSSNNITNPDSVILRVSALRQSVAIGNIGNTKPTPDSSAKLDVQSLTKGVLFPRMTTTQRLAIVLPATGLMVYDLTIKREVDYDGANWNYSPKVFTGTAAPTTTPLAVGDDFIDTTNKKAYKAMGTSSSSDWVILN